jgi:hypothetical protein
LKAKEGKKLFDCCAKKERKRFQNTKEIINPAKSEANQMIKNAPLV